MVEWEYGLWEYGLRNKKVICGVLGDIGYKYNQPDRRFQGEPLEFKKYEDEKMFHMQISLKKTRIHISLHRDVQKENYHKGISGGEALYEEKEKIIKQFEKFIKEK